MASQTLAQPGTGIVHAWLAGAPEVVAGLAAEARRHAVRLGGSLVVERAPLEVKQRVDVWGDPGPAGRLMVGIKRRYDPTGCLNPGRFVGGI